MHTNRNTKVLNTYGFEAWRSQSRYLRYILRERYIDYWSQDIVNQYEGSVSTVVENQRSSESTECEI